MPRVHRVPPEIGGGSAPPRPRPGGRRRRGVRVLALGTTVLAGLGSPGDGPRAQAAASAVDNVVALTVRTPRGGFNRMVVTVTVCAPGTERCATIDDVMIDTGATGLRLEASAVLSALRLPPLSGTEGRPLAECLRYVHDVAWGPLVRVDLRIGGLTARDLPIQIIEDVGGPARARPDSCPRSDARPTASGPLGLGPDPTDCRGACVQNPDRPVTFTCSAEGCRPVSGPVAEADRLPNPVARLPGHDNGVVIALPAPPPDGAASVTGTLTFGVGTADDNRLGSPAIVPLDRAGRFTTLYGGTAYPRSTIDSGTPTYILADAALPRCAGMPWAYCAVPARDPTATMLGRDGAPVPVPFRVGLSRRALEGRVGAADDVAVAAEPASRAFVWGAPFFLGKRVAVLMDGRGVPGRDDLIGPLYAFETFPAR